VCTRARTASRTTVSLDRPTANLSAWAFPTGVLDIGTSGLSSEIPEAANVFDETEFSDGPIAAGTVVRVAAIPKPSAITR
jgi:hypothetical protein